MPAELRRHAFRPIPPSHLAFRLVVLGLLILLHGALRLTAAEVTLRWSDNSTNESGFKIERAVGSGAFAQIAVTAPNATSYRDTTLKPATTYRYRLRAYNSAGNSGYSNTASITTSSNTAPTISSIPNRTIAMNGTTGAISFTIGDAETPADRLTLVRNASNQTLIPLSNIVLGGTGATRTVTIRPAANRTGYSTIWIQVSDGQAKSYIGFVLTVVAGTTNTSPTISAIANRTIPVNGSSGPISFTIGDSQTAASSLTLTRNSSDLALIPLSGITFGGSGANRTVTIRPAANRTGWATIWVKVSDGSLSNYVRFVVTVQASTTAASIGTSTTTSALRTTALASPLTASTAGATSDALRFAYLPLTGDAELTVRVTGLGRQDDGTRGGLMYRTSTAADAPCAGVYVTGSSRLLFVHRPSAGAPLQTIAPLNGAVPVWLRLTRVGDTFYGFTSQDGTTWELVEFANVSMNDSALAGTAVTSSTGTADSTTATFAQFGID